MEINIFQNNLIPCVIFAIGILILSLNLIDIASSRKVTLKERTGAKKNATISIAVSSILKIFHKFDYYIKILDKVQFIYGYFSATSEKANRDKAERIIFNTVIVNLLIFIAIALFNVIWIVKFFAIILIVLFEYMYISTSISKKKLKLQQEFSILLREYIEGYVLTSNVRSSFEYSVNDNELSPLYKVLVNRLISQLSSVTGSDEAFTCFCKRIDSPMASVFVSLVQSSYSTKKNVVENLLELQNMLSEETIEEKIRKNKMSTARNNIILWAVVCIVELFGVGYVAKTATGNYFLTTSLGQNLLLCTIGSIVLSIACIKISESV